MNMGGGRDCRAGETQGLLEGGPKVRGYSLMLERAGHAIQRLQPLCCTAVCVCVHHNCPRRHHLHIRLEERTWVQGHMTGSRGRVKAGVYPAFGARLCSLQLCETREGWGETERGREAAHGRMQPYRVRK